MRDERVIYRFGPYELDPAQRHLLKGEAREYLPDRQMDVLICLLANAGRLVRKEALIAAAWPDTAVGDSSIVQAVKGLRDRLGRQPSGEHYIQTLVRKGYRFVAPVEHADAAVSPTSHETLAEPHRAFVEGRVALETFERDEVNRARTAFEQALRVAPRSAAAHKGMATACFLAFEATRADLAPDVEQLRLAAYHAREGCRLDPRCGDAWGTLALVRHRMGETRDAVIAARTAVSLDEGDWCHHLRLAVVSWGQERIRAAHRALSLNPRSAQAYWLAATVYVARGAYVHALDELRAGCVLQDRQWTQRGRFTAVGLHWLHGLVLAAMGADDAALVELQCELAAADERHVYGRESTANTWYAIGAVHARHGRRDAAVAAFREALTRVPGHPLALIGLAAAGSQTKASACPRRELDAPQSVESGRRVDAAIATAAALAVGQQYDDAARVCDEALRLAAPGSAGWMLPVEPMLHVTAHRDVWAAALGTLADRAV